MDLTWHKKFQQFQKALNSLDEILNMQNIPTDVLRDSKIQRFEYCSELFWKMLRLYLVQEKGIKITAPKEVLRQCKTEKLFSLKDLELLLRMIDDRNATSHAYAINLAKKIESHIPEYFRIMKQVEGKIAEKNK